MSVSRRQFLESAAATSLAAQLAQGASVDKKTGMPTRILGKTGDGSRNNWFVALLTNGEGWHNNHHATPRACSQGHRWWEIDLTYTFVRGLQLVGLAWDVVPVRVPTQYRSQESVVISETVDRGQRTEDSKAPPAV